MLHRGEQRAKMVGRVTLKLVMKNNSGRVERVLVKPISVNISV
jgi:hypothetical protein